MGLCKWLSTAQPEWLDLDALLSVQLPGHITPTDNLQFLTCAYMVYMKNQTIDAAYVQKHLHVVYLTPHLNETVREFFGADTNLAKFLCFKYGKDLKKAKKYHKEAAQLLQSHGNVLLRNFLAEQKDVEAFTYYCSETIEKEEPPALYYFTVKYDSLVQVLEEYKKNIERSTGNQTTYNYWVREYNKVIAEANEINNEINKLGIGFPTNVGVGGGVNVHPANIKVRRGKSVSEIEHELSGLKESGSGGAGADSLARIARKDIPDITWKKVIDQPVGDVSYTHQSGGGTQNAWTAAEEGGNGWHSQIQVAKDFAFERSFDPEKGIMQVTEYFRGTSQRSMIGKRVDDQLIVFTPVDQPAVKLHTPPGWWYE
jgi:hypothetical protein